MLKKTVLCPYPIKFLEDKLHGIMTGDFIMFAAGTGTGKSTISRILTQNAIFNSCPVVLYSLEDETDTFVSDSVYRECVKSGCQLDFREWLVDNTKNPEKYKREAMIAAQRAMLNDKELGIPLQVVHEMQVGGNWNVRSILQSMAQEAEKGYRLFILDHLDVLVPSERPDDMVRVINALWRFVSEKQIALITFSQLATGRNKESLCPCLDDLRGSKSKVHTPTVVCSIARHNYGYYSDLAHPEASPTYCRILKNRQGGKLATAVCFFERGHYVQSYQEVESNESGTMIDSMTAREFMKEAKKK